MFRSGPNCLEFNTLITCSFIDAWLHIEDKAPFRPPVLQNPKLASLHHLNLGVQHGFRDNFRYAAINVSDNTSDIFHLTQFLYYTELYLPPCPSVFLIPPADPTYGVGA